MPLYAFAALLILRRMTCIITENMQPHFLGLHARNGQLWYRFLTLCSRQLVWLDLVLICLVPFFMRPGANHLYHLCVTFFSCSSSRVL